MTVRLFARLRDVAGTDELVRELPEGATVATLWTALAGEYPALSPYASSISTAVNADYVRMHTALSEGDEVAFLPPVSGGAELKSSVFPANS